MSRSKRSARNRRASNAVAASLSTTASTPCRAPSLSTITGTPPPPAQTTITSCSNSSSIVESSTIDRDHAPPAVAVGRDRPAALDGKALRLVGSVHRADRLRRVTEARVERVHNGLGEQRCDVPARQHVGKLALEEVTDHSFALGSEQIERVAANVAVRLRLECQEPNLRTVAVGDDEAMIMSDAGEHGSRELRVLFRDLGLERLTAPLQCVAAERGDYEHALLLRPRRVRADSSCNAPHHDHARARSPQS